MTVKGECNIAPVLKPRKIKNRGHSDSQRILRAGTRSRLVPPPPPRHQEKNDLYASDKEKSGHLSTGFTEQ
jgi:hypothetical protein